MFIDGVALTLGILFVVLFLLGFSQLVQVLRSHDSNLSLRNAIVFLLTSSALLRCIFWLKTAFPLGMSNQVLMIVYFLPIWLDFSGLSGLAVFYANIINLSGPYRKYPGYISFAFNFCFLVIDLALASMLDDPNTSSKVKDELSNLYQVYSILLDFLLASLLLYFGYRFRQVGSEKISYMLPRSFRTFLYVNWLVVLCYTIRGVCNCFFYANEVLPASMRYVYFSKTHPMTPFSVLLFFTFIELLPNFCVIMLLWKVSDSKSYDKTYTFENIKNDMFSTDSSRDYLLSSSESPMYSTDKDSTDNSQSSLLHSGSIHVIYSDIANSKDNYYISPSQFHNNYKADSSNSSSGGGGSGGGDGSSSNNSNSSSPGNGFSRSLYDNDNDYYPKISSRNNTPNSTGHALSPLKATQQSHDDNNNNNNNNKNNKNNNNYTNNYNNDNNNSRSSNNIISAPSTINILNFSTGGVLASEGSSPPTLVGPSMNSPGSESNNSIIWRQIQSNLGDGGRMNSRASMSAGSDDMLLNLEQGGLLGDAISGGKITTSMLYSAGDEASGTTPPLLSSIEGGTVTLAAPRHTIGSSNATTKASNKNHLSDSNSTLQSTDPMTSPGRTGKSGKKLTNNKKEKYSNTVSPRDILLMSIKEDP